MRIGQIAVWAGSFCIVVWKRAADVSFLSFSGSYQSTPSRENESLKLSNAQYLLIVCSRYSDGEIDDQIAIDPSVSLNS